MHAPTATELDRFFAKVVLPPDPDDCWEWIGATACGSYGRFWDPSTKRGKPAHRVVYEWFRGPIPANLVIDHLCRVPACVNPTHLDVTTQRMNVLRGTAPAARQARQTHCIHGHDLSDAYLSSGGRRRLCRSCHRDINNRRRQLRKD